MHGTFCKRTHRDVCCWENFRGKYQRDLGCIHAYVTKIIRECVYACLYMCVKERERERQPTSHRSRRELVLSKRMAEYLFTPVLAVTPRSCQSFIAVRTIPNSNMSGFISLSSRINRDFHRARLNERKLDKSSASRCETHDYYLSQSVFELEN